MEKLSITIAEESLRFSSGHMTVYPDGKKERLHGHNYYPSVTLQVDPNFFLPYEDVQDGIKKICASWNERVLLPAKSKYLTVHQKASEIEFELCGARYVLPVDEVVLLPVDSITTENLAELFCRELFSLLSASPSKIYSIQVKIEELPGLGAIFEIIPPR